MVFQLSYLTVIITIFTRVQINNSYSMSNILLLYFNKIIVKVDTPEFIIIKIFYIKSYELFELQKKTENFINILSSPYDS